MSAHTPGPWEWREWADDVPFPAGVPVAIHRAGDPTMRGRICEMVAQGDGEYSPEVTAANARLIAAAPELLEALKFAEAILSEHVAASCDICGGEGGWKGEGVAARMTPLRHKSGCEYLTVTAAIVKAERR